MLYILLVQKHFWWIKGEEKSPSGTCGEPPPLTLTQSPHTHPTSPKSGASCSHKLTRTYNSITAPISTNSSFFIFFFPWFILLTAGAESCLHLTPTNCIYTSLILKAYFYRSNQRQKNPGSQLLEAGRDTTLAHSYLFPTTSFFQF